MKTYFQRRLASDIHKQHTVSLQHVFKHLSAGQRAHGWPETHTHTCRDTHTHAETHTHTHTHTHRDTHTHTHTHTRSSESDFPNPAECSFNLLQHTRCVSIQLRTLLKHDKACAAEEQGANYHIISICGSLISTRHSFLSHTT